MYFNWDSAIRIVAWFVLVVELLWLFFAGPYYIGKTQGVFTYKSYLAKIPMTLLTIALVGRCLNWW